MKQTLMEAGEGQRGTHMGFINAVVPVSNHVIDWSARLGVSLTRTRDINISFSRGGASRLVTGV